MLSGGSSPSFVQNWMTFGKGTFSGYKIISNIFESPKSIKAFSSYVSAKNKAVGRSTRHIDTRASSGFIINHCAAAMAPICNSCVAWHAIRNIFSLSPTVLELWAEIGSNGYLTITTRGNVMWAFQLDGVQWLQSYTICQLLGKIYLNEAHPRVDVAPKKTPQ